MRLRLQHRFLLLTGTNTIGCDAGICPLCQKTFTILRDLANLLGILQFVLPTAGCDSIAAGAPVEQSVAPGFWLGHILSHLNPATIFVL
jgi:hypothetical protein